jgi:perosamine synthetase
MISHNRPLISSEDRGAVDAVLASGWIAQGPSVAALETSFVRYHASGGACAVSNGTASLFLALKALGAGAGSEVAVPSYACSALLNAVFMIGALPKVVDVLPDTFCMDPRAIQTQAPDARFVFAVHTYGAMANVEAIKKQDKVVIEDCCQALGGTVSNVPLGGTGDAAVFSFYATKIITGGQGGLVWSRDSAVAEKVRDYRQFDCRETYEPRFNFQMTDIQATLVNSQMARLEAIRERRTSIARDYIAAMPPGLSTQAGLLESGRMAYRFVVVTPDQSVREALHAHLAAAGVECIVPVDRFELLHRYLKLDPADYPISERLADTTLSLPMHLCLSDEDVSVISNALYRFQP